MKGLGQWIAIALTAAAALGSIAWTYGQNTQRITTIEKRQEEDRRETKQNINEVKEHAKAIDATTQLILQELRAMKAVQDAERRRERGR